MVKGISQPDTYAEQVYGREKRRKEVQPIICPANFLETFVLKYILVERETHTPRRTLLLLLLLLSHFSPVQLCATP